MGRGNVCVTGSYEGLFYIDNDDLRVYRRNDPYAKEEETSLQRDLSCEDFSSGEWLLDEVGSSYEEEDVLECFCAELRKLCPSFQPAANSNVWLGNERRVILENELFYICVEDNEWSLAVELVQKDGYSDCESTWMAGLQKRRYRGYLDSMKKGPAGPPAQHWRSHRAVDSRNYHQRGGWRMLSDMIDDLVRADCPQEKEAAYRQLEKLGVDRITADVIADERRKEAHL